MEKSVNKIFYLQISSKNLFWDILISLYHTFNSAFCLNMVRYDETVFLKIIFNICFQIQLSATIRS